MSRGDDRPDGVVACGPLYAALLRVLLPADRREEFVGDLLEEAATRRGGPPPGPLATWLWLETLQSAPALVALRVRRLVAARGHQPALLMAGGRVGHRGWPISLAVSLGAHALLLVAVFTWTFARVDEIAPARAAIDLSSIVPSEIVSPAPPAGAAVAPAFESPPEARPVARRPRPIRRPFSLTSDVPVLVADDAPPAAALAATPPPDDGGPGEPRAEAPDPSVTAPKATPARAAVAPLVADKRCLSCPAPTLPPAFARLGVDQEMKVKTCVNASGKVTSVDVLAGFDPMVDARVVDTVRGWHLVPYAVEGRPVPFCYATSFVFASR
jgi:periplasmic protein TonB